MSAVESQGRVIAASPAESAPTETTASRHIPSLDGIRAVSFLLVFASHIGPDRLAPGGFGVTVFFFLSGLLITTLMRAEYTKNRHVNLAHFWIRRALRILPPFYVVLVGATVWSLLYGAPGSLSVPATLARAFHYTNYWTIYHGHDGEPVGTALYWSLAVEEHFYILFPWLYVGMQRLRLSPCQQASTLWALCGVTLVWRCILVGMFHVSDNRIYLGTDTRMDSILFGCALAVWHNPVLDRPVLDQRWLKYAILPAALLVLLISIAASGPVFRNTLRYTLQGIALSFVFIAAVRFPKWPPFRVLNWPPLVFIGLLSYSLYLMHHTVIAGVRHMIPAAGVPVQAVGSFALSVALAWIMYIVLERPCARLRRRLTD
jgi:peptidoglycan/LPS O-acetylase OafA/YrhL